MHVENQIRECCRARGVSLGGQTVLGSCGTPGRPQTSPQPVWSLLFDAFESLDETTEALPEKGDFWIEPDDQRAI